nr:protein kinase-like domain, phloem protein 2-like protein [Tanacetum cinerariifolium]
MLSQDTEYVSYLVFKLSEKCQGLHCPVKVRDVLHKENNEVEFVYFISPSALNINGNTRVPKQREDGWMEIQMWKFNSTHEFKDGSLSIDIKFTSHEGTIIGKMICETWMVMKSCKSEAGDNVEASVCCVENTVEDRIMNSGASFHATYHKEELERFKLLFGKALETSSGKLLKVPHRKKRESLYMIEVRPERIGAIINGSGSAAVWWFRKAKEYFLYNVSEEKETVEVKCLKYDNGREYSSYVKNGTVMLKMVSKAPLQFEEEWRGNDTSLAHLKVFGCDSFVKVKDIYGEAMKCTFIGSGSFEMRYSFRIRRVTGLSEVEILHLWTQFIKPDLRQIQSQGESSDTSEGSENIRNFKDNGRSEKEYSKDGASCKEGGFEIPPVQRSTRESRALVRDTKRLIHLMMNIKVGDEREVEVMHSFNWPLSELIMDVGVLPEIAVIPSLMMLVRDTLYQKDSLGLFLSQKKYDVEILERAHMVQDYALWDVIENGNLFKPVAQKTTNDAGTSTTHLPGPVTTEEKAQKKNYVKARSMLLMALPNEHMMMFNQYNDAKTLFAAIETRFGGNEATKKTPKTFLKKLNKFDLDTMSIDDLYNNFKIVEQKVKGTACSDSSSQNMAFMTSPSTNSTNEVPTAYEISTTSTQSSISSTKVNTANLIDANVYALLTNQSNGSQLVHKDLEQIHKDDLEKMDLKWQLALLSMRAKRFFQKTKRKITINGSDIAGFDKSKVECYNFHKMGHFSKSADSQETKIVIAGIKIALKGPYMAEDEVPTNMAFMAFSNSKSCETESKNASKEIPNELKESPDALLVKDRVLDNKNYLVKSLVVVEKKTIVSTIAKIEFVKAKQQEKPVRKPVKNNAPRVVIMKTGLRSLNTARPVNTAHPKTTVHCARPMLHFSKSIQSTVKRPYQQRTSYTNKSFRQTINTARQRPVNTVRPRPVNTVRLRLVNTARPNLTVVNVAKVNQVNVVMTSACWIWRPTGNVIDYISKDSRSYMLKRFNYVDL